MLRSEVHLIRDLQPFQEKLKKVPKLVSPVLRVGVIRFD
jgi:hypothetical protein